MTHDPSACLATRPTSTVRSRSPNLIDSFKYFLTVMFVRLLLTRPDDQRPARSVSCTAIWVCTQVAWVPKIEKAAEPGREALAAFFDCKAARVAWFPVSPSRSARIKLFDNACFFRDSKIP